MWKNFALSVVMLLVVLMGFSCKNSPNQTSGANADKTGNTTDTQAATSTFNRYYEDEDALVTFFVQAVNGEVTEARVRTKGLENEFDQTFTIEGSITDGHLLDLDGDGFNELYLVYRLTDDSGNLHMIAVRSNSYLDAGVVGVQKINERRKTNTDRIFAINGKLRRSFTDLEGNTINYAYQLVKGSQGHYLVPVKG